MLRTNLATRPFYNERGVHGVLGVTLLIVLALTIFNVTQIVLLSRRHLALGQEIAAAEHRAEELRARAARARQAIDPKQVAAISDEAREANALISQRLFSWTDLLNRLETTLPDGVRITMLRPQVEDDGSVTVQMTVTGRSIEDIEEFMARLEKTTTFSGVYPRDDIPTTDGLVQATLEGTYAAAP